MFYIIVESFALYNMTYELSSACHYVYSNNLSSHIQKRVTRWKIPLQVNSIALYTLGVPNWFI